MLGTLIQPGSSHLSYHSEVGFPTTRQGGPRAELGVPGLTFSSVALNLLITPLPQRPRIHMIMQGFPGNLCPQLETPPPPTKVCVPPFWGHSWDHTESGGVAQSKRNGGTSGSR